MPGDDTQADVKAGETAAKTEHRGLAARYLRAKRKGKRLFLIAGSLFGFGLKLIGVAVAVVFGVLLWMELTRDQIEIQPISVPKSLAEAGYTPEVAARRLQDAIDTLTAEASAAGARGLQVSMHGDLPEIVVPTVGMSLSTLATYLRTFFHASVRTAISGEFTLEGQQLSLFMRLNGREIFRSQKPVSADRPDALWGEAAEALIGQISPYQAALAAYDKDPARAIELADRIIKLYPESDENAAWAHLIRCQRAMDQFEFAGARKEIEAVLTHAPKYYIWMPSWVPFGHPASYIEPAQFYYGQMLLNQNKFAAAADELRKATRLDPDDAAAQHYLGVALQGLKKTTEANVAFDEVRNILLRQTVMAAREAGEHGPSGSIVHTNFGNALAQENREHAQEYALVQFERAVEVDPKDAQPHLAFCSSLTAWNMLDRAYQECSSAKVLAPRNPAVYISLANVLIQQKVLQGARNIAIQALKLDPNSPLVYQLLGSIHLINGQWKEAASFYREAIKFAPDVADHHAARAEALINKNEPDEAINEYNKAIEFDPDNPDRHNALGNALFSSERFDEAANEYKTAITLNPDNSVFHLNLAHTFQNLHSLDAAVDEYKQAMRSEPGNADAYNDIGNSLFTGGYYSQAQEFYNEATKLNPYKASFHLHLASAMYRQDRTDEAIDELQKAAESDPQDANIHNDLGKLYFKSRKFDLATRSFEKACSTAPGQAVFHENLGRALVMQNEFDSAVSELKKAVALEPENAAFHHRLALALTRQNRFDREVFAEYRRAIKLDPKVAAPYYDLAGVLDDMAKTERSRPNKIHFLLAACRLLVEGMQQAPSDSEPPLDDMLANIRRELPAPLTCP